MIDHRLASTLKKIKLHTRRIMQSTLSGDYLSAFKGSGLEFHQIREYQRGDEVRMIDWNSSAKMNKVMVKQYIQERDRSVIVVLDVSASGGFSSSSQARLDQAKTVAATLSLIASENKDKVGLLTFSDRIHSWTEPSKNNIKLGLMLEKVLKSTPEGKTDLSVALRHLSSLKQKNAVVFFISDWIDDISRYEKLFMVATKRFDFVGITISDPREHIMPSIGLIDVQDPETGTIFTLKTSDALTHTLASHHVLLERLFIRARTDLLKLNTHESFEKPLISFFHTRMRR